jgi:hypothetical protein
MGPQAIWNRLVQMRVLRKSGRSREADAIHDGLISSLVRRRPVSAEQLALRLLKPDDLVPCDKLHSTIPARVCVMRQRISDLQTTQDHHRGTSTEYPHCVTARCALGRHRREILDPDHTHPDRSSSLVSRRRFSKSEQAAQLAARARKAKVGLLDETSTVDGLTPAVESEGEE